MLTSRILGSCLAALIGLPHGVSAQPFQDLTHVVEPMGKKAFCRGDGCKTKVKPLRLRQIKKDKAGAILAGDWRKEVGFKGVRFKPDVTVDTFPMLPDRLGKNTLTYAITQGVNEPVLGLYGVRPPRYSWTPPLVLTVGAPNGYPYRVFDFSKYAYPVGFKKTGSGWPVDQFIQHAEVRGDVLYVVVSHKTYASATKGEAARIMALSVSTGEPIWLSKPLVSNAGNFLVFEDVILAGYGFTGEKDYLYQINRHNGQTIKRHALDSGPGDLYLVPPGKLYLRTYNRSYIFSVSAR